MSKELKIGKICLKCGERMVYEDVSQICPECTIKEVDESRSNPMVVAMQFPDCPINEICFYMVVGFGTIAEQCKNLKVEGNIAECLYGA